MVEQSQSRYCIDGRYRWKMIWSLVVHGAARVIRSRRLPSLSSHVASPYRRRRPLWLATKSEYKHTSGNRNSTLFLALSSTRLKTYL
jgi:hypothetical protein